MHAIVTSAIEVVIVALNLYWYVVLAAVVLSWLVAFGIINSYNSTVRAVLTVITRLTEPVLRPIRRILPDLGTVDLSPIVLWLGLYFVIRVLEQLRYTI